MGNESGRVVHHGVQALKSDIATNQTGKTSSRDEMAITLGYDTVGTRVAAPGQLLSDEVGMASTHGHPNIIVYERHSIEGTLSRHIFLSVLKNLIKYVACAEATSPDEAVAFEHAL
ncbi:hypothetical protein QQS21_003668 [Conoideocrella luteorostrata]|uniref:Uncharacterized protein n=1 Tax=Conoideocrella luteorostrata TaxID=1105319 RepID=A0AAJ0FVE2_9HYPO|nr:hypothetical protein QQS21_003668 [Conoideocrella luteorostrata]